MAFTCMTLCGKLFQFSDVLIRLKRVWIILQLRIWNILLYNPKTANMQNTFICIMTALLWNISSLEDRGYVYELNTPRSVFIQRIFVNETCSLILFDIISPSRYENAIDQWPYEYLYKPYVLNSEKRGKSTVNQLMYISLN